MDEEHILTDQEMEQFGLTIRHSSVVSLAMNLLMMLVEKESAGLPEEAYIDSVLDYAEEFYRRAERRKPK